MYSVGAELPDYALSWEDGDGNVINFSSGWTFTVRLGIPGQEALLEKTTGIIGAATSPNVVISWAAGELDDLDPGSYVLTVRARHTASGKDRDLITLLPITAAIT